MLRPRGITSRGIVHLKSKVYDKHSYWSFNISQQSHGTYLGYMPLLVLSQLKWDYLFWYCSWHDLFVGQTIFTFYLDLSHRFDVLEENVTKTCVLHCLNLYWGPSSGTAVVWCKMFVQLSYCTHIQVPCTWVSTYVLVSIGVGLPVYM